MPNRSDVILDALGDASRRRIVQELLRGPLTQRQIRGLTGMDSSLLSRQMAKLRDAGLVVHAGGHGPYALRAEAETRNALVAVGELGVHLSKLALADDEAHLRSLRKTGLRVSSAIRAEE